MLVSVDGGKLNGLGLFGKVTKIGGAGDLGLPGGLDSEGLERLEVHLGEKGVFLDGFSELVRPRQLNPDGFGGEETGADG